MPSRNSVALTTLLGPPQHGNKSSTFCFSEPDCFSSSLKWFIKHLSMTTFPQGQPLKIHPHVACDWTAFFLKAGWYFHCVCESNLYLSIYLLWPTLRLHTPLGHGKQSCNIDAVVQVSQILFSTLLGTHTRSGPALSHGNSIFNTLRNCHTDLESVAQLHGSTDSNTKGPVSSQSP